MQHGVDGARRSIVNFFTVTRPSFLPLSACTFSLSFSRAPILPFLSPSFSLSVLRSVRANERRRRLPHASDNRAIFRWSLVTAPRNSYGACSRVPPQVSRRRDWAGLSLTRSPRTYTFSQYTRSSLLGSSASGTYALRVFLHSVSRLRVLSFCLPPSPPPLLARLSVRLLFLSLPSPSSRVPFCLPLSMLPHPLPPFHPTVPSSFARADRACVHANAHGLRANGFPRPISAN